MVSDGSEAEEVEGPKVFISYRRSDTEDVAERLAFMLKGDLGSRNVFRDRESMLLGEPWRDALQKAMSEADAALFLVGPGWEGGSPSDRRIDEADDAVRREAAEALSRKVRANPIPLLIDRTDPPERLPDDVRALFKDPNYVSMGRDEVTTEASAAYQSILVGVWAALARLVPRGVVILGESDKMVELDGLVEELADAGALDSQTLSRFASGVYVASWRDVEKLKSDFPRLIVQSTDEPSDTQKARLAAFAALWPGAAVAVTGIGAGALIAMGPSLGFGGSSGTAALAQVSSAELAGATAATSTASSGGLGGIWASAGIGAKVAAGLAGIAIVVGSAMAVTNAIDDDGSEATEEQPASAADESSDPGVEHDCWGVREAGTYFQGFSGLDSDGNCTGLLGAERLTREQCLEARDEWLAFVEDIQERGYAWAPSDADAAAEVEGDCGT